MVAVHQAIESLVKEIDIVISRERLAFIQNTGLNIVILRKGETVVDFPERVRRVIQILTSGFLTFLLDFFCASECVIDELDELIEFVTTLRHFRALAESNDKSEALLVHLLQGNLPDILLANGEAKTTERCGNLRNDFRIPIQESLHRIFRSIEKILHVFSLRLRSVDDILDRLRSLLVILDHTNPQGAFT